MRCFVALQLSPDTRNRLAVVSQRLQSWNLPGRWVADDALHLTLCFIGEVDHTEAAQLPAALGEVATALTAAPPPSLRLVGLGAFAGSSHPRVVYAAVADPAGWCRDLHHDLCAALDITPDKGFHPHVTLCRPQAGRPGDAPPRGSWPELLAGNGQADWGACVVDGLHLLESRPAPSGAGRVYRTLAQWPLPEAQAGLNAG